MIIIHAYCSYKSSPIGFAYGSYKYNPDKDTPFYYLNNNDNNSFILSSFEDGKIRRACGKLPDSKRYIFLVRKMKHDYGLGHDVFGRDVDMNFAFEFDCFSEFKAFTTGFVDAEKKNSKQLYRELADCICPDMSVEIYKLSINKKVFDQWFSKMNEIEPSEKYNNLEERIKITASSSLVDYSRDIADIYQLSEQDLDGELIEIKRIKESADYIYPVKKNRDLLMTPLIEQSNLKKRVILGIVLLVVVFISLILFTIVRQYRGEEFNVRKKSNSSAHIIELNLECIVIGDAIEVCLSQDLKIIKCGFIRDLQAKKYKYYETLINIYIINPSLYWEGLFLLKTKLIT